MGNNFKQSQWDSQDLSPSGKTNSDFLLFDNLLNYKEAARYLSISEVYLRRLKSEGKISFVQVGSRAVRFKVSSLNRWATEREVQYD